MKNLRLLWRLFTIFALLLIIASIVAISSRPLNDSILGEISVSLPFITLYYVIFGIHVLNSYEENGGRKKRVDNSLICS